jgi:hypothetical protein
MILHGFRAHSRVVTDTGCCPSAARRRRPLTFGTQIDAANPEVQAPASSRCRRSWSSRLSHPVPPDLPEQAEIVAYRLDWRRWPPASISASDSTHLRARDAYPCRPSTRYLPWLPRRERYPGSPERHARRVPRRARSVAHGSWSSRRLCLSSAQGMSPLTPLRSRAAMKIHYPSLTQLADRRTITDCSGHAEPGGGRIGNTRCVSV